VAVGGGAGAPPALPGAVAELQGCAAAELGAGAGGDPEPHQRRGSVAGATLQPPPSPQRSSGSGDAGPRRGRRDPAERIVLLCGALHAATGRPVVLLIDEYDSPLHAAWTARLPGRGADFFRTLLGSGLKENRHLHKAVITGILRVARESLFSGSTTWRCSPCSAERLRDTFGFTQGEVEAAGRRGRRAGGPPAGDRGLVQRLPRRRGAAVQPLVGAELPRRARPAPSLTGSTQAAPALIGVLLQHPARAGEVARVELLRGGSCARTISESLIFPDLTAHRRGVVAAAGGRLPQAAVHRAGRGRSTRSS
jgi:hypothetical protein